MQSEIQIVKPGPNGALITENGKMVYPPKDWIFLSAGDAGITRKITAQGIFWRVQIKKGKRQISKGIWAPSHIVLHAQKEVQAIRKTDSYKKKRAVDIKRRKKKQDEYEIEFCKSVESYLHFNVEYKNLQKKMAVAVTKHAIPIGSGSVARTALIPLEERAAHAVIAWMRHQTTSYDRTVVAKIKGERRAVRRKFAQQSVHLLNKYRNGTKTDKNCPLYKALQNK